MHHVPLLGDDRRVPDVILQVEHFQLDEEVIDARVVECVVRGRGRARRERRERREEEKERGGDARARRTEGGRAHGGARSRAISSAGTVRAAARCDC